LGGRGRRVSELEASLAYRVPGQSGIYRETLSPKKQKKKKKKPKNKQTNKRPPLDLCHVRFLSFSRLAL
jgi:hypothetical protein